MYLVSYKPTYENNTLEIFNETCTIMISYILLVFTDWEGKASIKYDTGYLLIALFCFNVAVNFLVIIIKVFDNLKLTVKKIMYIHK